MRILLITSSARGHALGEALARSRHTPDIISLCPNRNPGLRRLAAEHHVMDILDFGKILEIAKRARPDFAVIGPDDPIGAGLADLLLETGIPSVAPTKSLARIESSKSFARDLLQRHGIDASPKFLVIDTNGDLKEAEKSVHKFITEDLHESYVVKYDALKGGKGVKVSGEHLPTVQDGVEYAMECLQECGRVVLEEKLEGAEFSLLSFVSGISVAHMPAVQDHKRAFEGDSGPNTGGMGAFTDANHSLPFMDDRDLERAKEINQLTVQALLRECGESYKGILYGGYMAVRDGVRLIEFNARFGDPEALNLLPLLSSDFADLCLAIVHGELRENLVSFAQKATVSKYITPEGYPLNKHQRGKPVTFPVMPANARLYFGDVQEDDNGTLRLGGSRTAGIVGIADTILEAERIAETFCEQVEGPVRFRRDIGTAELVQKRVAMMRHLRR